MPSHPNRKWISSVKTASTQPDPGLFTQDARTIADQLASPDVSPKGPGSGMRMLTYYINRAGDNLSEARRAELERAKRLLHKRIASVSQEHPAQADHQRAS